MIQRNGYAIVQCESCGHRFAVDEIDIDYEMVSENERSMGSEYQWEGELHIKCVNCVSSMKLIVNAWEYPIGVINHEDVTSVNCSVLESNIAVNMSDYVETGEKYEISKEEVGRGCVIRIEGAVGVIGREILKNADLLYAINPRDFERLVQGVFQEMGFKTELTSQTRDGGRDIIALSDMNGIRTKYLIECKRYAKGNKVSVDLVRSLYGVTMQEGANKGILVTTSTFTRDSMKFASNPNTKWLLELKNGDELLEWIKKYSEKMS